MSALVCLPIKWGSLYLPTFGKCLNIPGRETLCKSKVFIIWLFLMCLKAACKDGQDAVGLYRDLSQAASPRNCAEFSVNIFYPGEKHLMQAWND